MNTHLPQWTSEITKRFVTGEDQLGVESAAQSYQQWLVPGVISTTDRARYYSFYAWVLYRFINWHESSRLMTDFRGLFYRRHEVAFMVANIAYNYHQLDGQFVGGLVGSGNNNAKGRRYWEEGDPISLDQNYFKNKLGGFGQYYATSMRVMGIINDPEKPQWVYRLTRRGEAIAKAFEQSMSGTAYFNKLVQDGELEEISRNDALEYGNIGSLNPEILARGKDLELLRDTFFRFDQEGEKNAHVRRRLTFGMTLDIIRQAGGCFTEDMLRPVLYLGEFSPRKIYTPSDKLKKWYQRWRMVQVRQIFTFGLQCLWGAFILHLRNQEYGLSIDNYMNWVTEQLSVDLPQKEYNDYLNELVGGVGLPGSWEYLEKQFDQACNLGSGIDEYSLYLDANKNYADKTILIQCGVQILAQLFLRFFSWYSENDAVWLELAKEERLPIFDYFQELEHLISQDNFVVSGWLEWIYREYILGQHEFMALRKLRYQGYDTFKFYFRDGIFHWPFVTPDVYREPIRLAYLRLFNVITLLTDLGLVVWNDEGLANLSDDGEKYWQLTIGSIQND